MPMLENFDPQTLVNFLSSEQAPVVLGKIGQAVMGPNQNTWQAKLGGVAAELGQSSIAASAAKKRNEAQTGQNAAIAQAIKTGQMPPIKTTPVGEPGADSVVTKQDGSGVTTTIKKENPPPVTQQAPGQQAGAAPAVPPQTPAQSQPTVGAAPVNQPQGFMPPGTSMGVSPQLPMALAGGGMGDTGQVNLAGLSPEQIASIGKVDNEAQSLRQSRVNELFSNTYKMALTDAVARNDFPDIVEYKSPLTGQTYPVRRQDLPRMVDTDIVNGLKAQMQRFEALAKQAEAQKDFAQAAQFRAQAADIGQKVATFGSQMKIDTPYEQRNPAAILRMGGNPVSMEELRVRMASSGNWKVETYTDPQDGMRKKGFFLNGQLNRTLGNADDPKVQQDIDLLTSQVESNLKGGKVVDGKGNKIGDLNQSHYDMFNSNSSANRIYVPSKGDYSEPKQIDLPMGVQAKSVHALSQQFGVSPEAVVERMRQRTLVEGAGNVGR